MEIFLYDNGKLPEYSNVDDAAMDCFAASNVEWSWENGVQTALVPLGFGIDIPKGYGLLLLSRSGQGFNHSVTLVNSVGLIDKSFGMNQVYCKLVKQAVTLDTEPDIKIGHKVCQMALVSMPRIFLDQISEPKTDNSKSGFGSSGL